MTLTPDGTLTITTATGHVLISHTPLTNSPSPHEAHACESAGARVRPSWVRRFRAVYRTTGFDTKLGALGGSPLAKNSDALSAVIFRFATRSENSTATSRRSSRRRP